MSNLLNLIRYDLQKFKTYNTTEANDDSIEIFLNANESPFENKISLSEIVNRYPEMYPDGLVELLAPLYGVQQNQLLLTRGSDEAIDLLIRLFCNAGKDSIMICPPTFSMYAFYAQLQDAKIVEVPLNQQNFQLNIPLIIEKWCPKIKIIFICSPNNPTGNLIKTEDIQLLCEKFSNQCIIALDEAYIEFSNASSMTSEFEKFKNLVILRTLSKAYGLAGIRCGLLLANQELIGLIKNIATPYAMSSLTLQAVKLSITPSRLKQITKQIQMIKLERKRLMSALTKIKCIKKVWKSDSNFIFIETNDAESISQNAKNNGILLRYITNQFLPGEYLRISVGLKRENNQLIQFLMGMQ